MVLCSHSFYKFMKFTCYKNRSNQSTYDDRFTCVISSISILFGGNHASIPIIIGVLVASVFITSKFHKFIKRVRTQYHDYVGESFESMIEDNRYAQALAPTIWLVFMMLINTILVVNESSIIIFWLIPVFLLVWFK